MPVTAATVPTTVETAVVPMPATVPTVVLTTLLLLLLLVLLLLPLLLVPLLPLLVLWLVLATAELVVELDGLQTVASLAAFRVPPLTGEESRARPWVTRWKLRRTSPIEDEMRMTPGFVSLVPACRDG
jgi:hypothetical protein